MSVKFFGSADKDDKGNIKSAYPAWYFDTHVEEYTESVNSRIRAIERGDISQSRLSAVKAEVKRMSSRLSSITKSKPNLQGKEKDEIAQAYKELESQLIEAYPSRDEDRMGYVSARDELKLMKQPCIKMDRKLAESLGARINSSGKVSRDEATKCWKIMGKTLDANTNIEKIRRDKRTDTYHTMDEMTQRALDNVEG